MDAFSKSVRWMVGLNENKIRRAIHSYRHEGALMGTKKIMNHIFSGHIARFHYFTNPQRYRQSFFPIVSVHRSGSTWLTNLIEEFPGVVNHQWSQITSRLPHNFEDGDFTYLSKRSMILKLHCIEAERNLRIIRKLGANSLFLFRDPRDVAVSWFHFAGNRRHHPENKFLEGKEIEEGLMVYIDRQLRSDCNTIRNWRAHEFDEDVLTLRYEDLRSNTLSVLRQAANHFGFSMSEEGLERIVRRHSFRNKSKRKIGVSNAAHPVRSGISGEWMKHFNPDIGAAFEGASEGILAELGYEDNSDWFQGL